MKGQLMGFALGLLAMACSPLAPTLEDVELIQAEWAIAQEKLQCMGFQRANRVKWSHFVFRKRETTFVCANVVAVGCFHSANSLIEWWSASPTVLRHEAGHAILWKLGNPYHGCYEHINREGCPSRYWESCQ